MGMVKSAMGIGGLLCMGIGDTIRVTLTADPVEEIYAAKKDPAGGRSAEGGCESHRLSHLRPHPDRPDPYGGGSGASSDELYEKHHRGGDGLRRQRAGEAAAADVGIAGGKGDGLIFRKGEILYKVPQERLVGRIDGGN